MQPELLDALADEVALTIQAALAPLQERLHALEARPLPQDGKDGAPGAPGPKGDPGPRGEPGERGLDAVAPADDLDPDAIAATVTDLLRKELGDLTPSPKRRVVRDAQGAVKFAIEEVT